MARASSAPLSNRQHDVETTGEPGIGAAGQRVGGGDVLGSAREAHDQPVAGLFAQPRLDRRDRSRTSRSPPGRGHRAHAGAPARAGGPRSMRGGSRTLRPAARGSRARRRPAPRRRRRAGSRATRRGRDGRPRATDRPAVGPRAWRGGARRSVSAVVGVARRAGCGPARAPARGRRVHRARARAAARATRGRPDRSPRASARSAEPRSRTRAARARGRCPRPPA